MIRTPNSPLFRLNSAPGEATESNLPRAADTLVSLQLLSRETSGRFVLTNWLARVLLERMADMSAETFVKLIEEMVDIKVQQQGELHLYGKPELARMLEEKRYSNRLRLEAIRQELIRSISGS